MITPENARAMQYELSDGKTYTLFEIAELAGISLNSARYRTRCSRDVDKVLAPFGTNVRRPVRQYHLSDGKKYTVADIVVLTGLHTSTITRRLQTGRRETDFILAPKSLERD